MRSSVIRSARLTTRKLIKLIAGFASDKKAGDIVVLDIRKVANFCDYFVICSGNSDRQVTAVSDGIQQGLKEHGIKVSHEEKDQNREWILLDLGDIIVHIFQKDAREFYGLEHLWQDAKKIDWQK